MILLVVTGHHDSYNTTATHDGPVDIILCQNCFHAMYSYCLPFTQLQVGLELICTDFHAVASVERVANEPAEIAHSFE